MAAFVHAVAGRSRTGPHSSAAQNSPRHSQGFQVLWKRFLRQVQADADWKASVIFASMYTLGNQRGTLGCWRDDHLVEGDEVDLDAVEAHLMKRLEVKVLARVGGKSSGEARFLEAIVAV